MTADPPALLTLDELLDGKLRVSREWWFRHRKALIETLGFPAPVKGIPGHWDPRAVRAWLDAQLPSYALRASEGLPSEATSAKEGGASISVVIDYDELLAARARGQAQRTDS